MRKIKRRTKFSKRRIKKATFWSKFYFSLLGLAILSVIAAAGLTYYSSQFTFAPVKTAGIAGISEEELNKALADKFTFSYKVFGNEIAIPNFLTSQSQKLNSVLAEFPELESVDIKKDFFGKSLSFEVRAKQPVAIWEEDYINPKKCYSIDKNASPIRNCEDISERPNLTITEEKETIKDNQSFKKSVLEGAQNILKQVAKHGLSGNSFSLLAEDKLSFNLDSGCKIYFNIQDNLDWQIQKLETILNKSEYANNLNNFKYIELRFGNRADLCKKGLKCALD